MTVLRKLAALTAVALAPVGTASAAGCPQYRCTAAHAGGAASTLTAASAAQLKPAWAFRTGGRVYGSPALARGTLYVPSEDGVVYAVDAATGTQRWAFRTGGAVWSTPAVHRGLVIFGSADHRIYAVAAATGKLRWRRRTGGDVTGSPAISRGVVYVGSHDHRLYALDARTGRRRWRFTTGDRVSSSPAVAGGVVYFGSNDDHLYALDAATGRERWRFKADAWVWSAPAVAKGLVFFTSNGTIDSPVSNGSGGHMYALDAATGKLAWTDPAALNGFASPAVAGDAVVASGFSGVHAYGLKTGDSRWAYAPEGHTFASAFVTNGVVFAVDSLDAGDGSLVALDLATGATLGEVSFPRLDFVYSSPVASGDKVVFGTGDGVLRALSPTGQPGRETVARAPAARRLPFSEHRDVLGDMLDPGSVAELRLPGDGVARDATSSDPSGLNQDFTIFHGYTEAGRKVLLDVKGAGVLTDLYMYDNVATAPSGAVAPPACKPDPGGAVAPKIALYVDDDTEPLFDMNAEDFYCGAAGFPFVAPLAGSYTGSQWSHVPVPYRKHLMVVADSAPSQNNFYFDFFYTQFPDARGVQSFDADRDHARYQALIDRWNAVGEDPYPQDGVRRVQGIASLEPGQSAKLLDVTGGGQV
ncbi:MAG: eukaryotic-like serine/threonine-protein kinase, partial [Solirubrobacteraceae bacterium]|nr:eukaryotic-like serine/threonine-protein kinase [Solirubrobacteraceae bacterium]